MEDLNPVQPQTKQCILKTTCPTYEDTTTGLRLENPAIFVNEISITKDWINVRYEVRVNDNKKPVSHSAVTINVDDVSQDFPLESFMSWIDKCVKQHASQ